MGNGVSSIQVWDYQGIWMIMPRSQAFSEIKKEATMTIAKMAIARLITMVVAAMGTQMAIPMDTQMVTCAAVLLKGSHIRQASLNSKIVHIKF